MKKILDVKPGGFYSKDNKQYPFDDYILDVDGVKLNFDVEEFTYEPAETAMEIIMRKEEGLDKKSEKAIHSLKITIDPGEKAKLIPKHAPYDNESKEK